MENEGKTKWEQAQPLFKHKQRHTTHSYLPSESKTSTQSLRPQFCVAFQLLHKSLHSVTKSQWSPSEFQVIVQFSDFIAETNGWREFEIVCRDVEFGGRRSSSIDSRIMKYLFSRGVAPPLGPPLFLRRNAVASLLWSVLCISVGLSKFGSQSLHFPHFCEAGPPRNASSDFQIFRSVVLAVGKQCLLQLVEVTQIKSQCPCLHEKTKNERERQ
jgi:hypothetical protein